MLGTAFRTPVGHDRTLARGRADGQCSPQTRQGIVHVQGKLSRGQAACRLDHLARGAFATGRFARCGRLPAEAEAAIALGDVHQAQTGVLQLVNHGAAFDTALLQCNLVGIPLAHRHLAGSHGAPVDGDRQGAETRQRRQHVLDELAFLALVLANHRCLHRGILRGQLLFDGRRPPLKARASLLLLLGGALALDQGVALDLRIGANADAFLRQRRGHRQRQDQSGPCEVDDSTQWEAAEETRE